MKADNIFISTASIKEKDLTSGIRKLSTITGNIELSGGSGYRADLLAELIALKKELSLNYLLHGYFPPPEKNFVFNFADTGVQTKDFIRTAMQYVGALEIPYYSLHAGLKKDFVFNDNELLFEIGNGCSHPLKDMTANIEWFHAEFPQTAIVVENLFPNNANVECAHLMHSDEIISFLMDTPGVLLLLDLGHLKVSSRILGFNYIDAVERIFEYCADKIREIHLSENDGVTDSHMLIHSDSVQYAILRRYACVINEKKILVTLEARNYSLEQISGCYNLIDSAVGRANN